MLKPPIPSNEQERLRELKKFEVLDTLPEDIFDEITRLAARICGTKIALVSLVDAKRQWFKSRYGLEATETPREVSFCGHAILQDEVFLVEDSALDPRFSDNPLVVGTPSVKFYAGVPLKTPSGFCIGTLCVIDSEKKSLTDKQTHVLRMLAREVIEILEIRYRLIKLRESEKKVTSRFDLSVVIVDDEVDLREVLEYTIYKFCASVRTFDNAETAIEYLRDHPTDLVLSDMKMPRIDGIEFLRLLRLDQRVIQPRFVFISGGLDLPEDVLEMIAREASGILAKPFNRDSILQKLYELFPEKTLEIKKAAGF